MTRRRVTTTLNAAAFSASDIRALRTCLQRNGGHLSTARAARFIELGLVRPREDVAECYTDRAPSYSPTSGGFSLLKQKGAWP